MKISRRSFILGGTAAIAAAGVSPVLSGCMSRTKSGIDPTQFECNGTYELGTGLENTYSSKVPIRLYRLTNKNGAELCITNFGARIVSLMMPDKNNKFHDMTLGFDNIKDYASFNTMPNNFHGALCGRYANRINKGSFTIDGNTYQLDTNEKGNILHGGKYGFHFQTFQHVETDEKSFLKLRLESPDGDMGFPGELNLSVVYYLNDDNTLSIYYEARTSKATPINVSNHTYWDPSGDPSKPITEDNLFICSKATTPVTDDQLIPTGEVLVTPNDSPFDFFGKKGEGKLVGKDINSDNPQMKIAKGYDHNFVLLGRELEQMYGVENDGKFQITEDGSQSLQGQANMVAKATSNTTGISMTIKSSEPAMQFFSCQDMDGSITGKGKQWNKYAAFVLEPQHYPDSPNHSNFPNTILRPGETFRSKSEYSFTCQ